MRVALVTDTFDEVNGVALTFRRLADFCAAEGVALDIWCHGAETASEHRGPVTVRRVRPLWPVRYYEYLVHDLAPRPDLLRQLLAQRYDLFHLPTPGSLGYVGLAAAKLGRTPIVGSYHTQLAVYAETFVARRFAARPPLSRTLGLTARLATETSLRAFYRGHDLILVPSPKAKAEVEGLVDVPVDYFRRGIDGERFSPALRRPSDRPVVLYVGRVSVEKNLDLLRRLATLPTPHRLVIVGDGPYRQQLQAALPEAEFPGYLRGDDLAAAYASADVFVFPSLTDTLGNVVLEAMASGAPPVVLDPTGPGSLLTPGRDGFIARDEADFVATVGWLLASRERCREYGRAARRSVLKRRWEIIFRDLLGHWRGAAGRRTWPSTSALMSRPIGPRCAGSASPLA